MTEPAFGKSPLDRELVLDGLNLLARLFWGPEVELYRELHGPGVQIFARLAQGLDEPGRQAAEGLAASLGGYGSAGELCRDLEPAYVALFISARGGIAASLYHSAYTGPGLLMGPPAEEMARRLARAGLEPGERPGEPPDHLSLELEYLAWLWDQGEEDAAAFARDFVAPWMERFTGLVERHQPGGVFALAARVVLSLMHALGRGGDLHQN